MANVKIIPRPVTKALATIPVFVLLWPLALSSAAAESLKVVYPTIGATATPLWIGKELGLFKKNSLDVDLVFIEGSPRATAALLSGSVDLIMGSGNATVQAVLAGAPLTLVCSLAGKIDYQLMVPAEIKSGNQLIRRCHCKQPVWHFTRLRGEICHEKVTIGPRARCHHPPDGGSSYASCGPHVRKGAGSYYQCSCDRVGTEKRISRVGRSS